MAAVYAALLIAFLLDLSGLRRLAVYCLFLSLAQGISLIFSILLLVISVRQTLLDIVPRPGHEYVGSAIFGIHMPVWSVFIAMGLLLGFAVRLALFGGLRSAREKDGSTIRRLTQGVTLYVVAICGVNFISVVAQCGIGDCHTFGYRLLP